MNRILLSLFLMATSAFGQAFTFSDQPFLAQGTTDWARRVVLNGGAMPSGNTIQAMEILRKGCIAAGLTNKIWSLCVFVPDSVAACRTPLFYHSGFTNWGNSNFVSGDLNINGLKGNATDKALDTGVDPFVIASDDDPPRGLAVIVTEGQTNRGVPTIGVLTADSAVALALEVSSLGASGFIPDALAGSLLIKTNDFDRIGYVSGNLTTNVTTNIVLYVASPLESHKALTNLQTAGNISWNPANGGTVSCFALKQDGTNTQYSASRLSLAMVTKGFTSAESSAFWTLALACRQQLGGGTGDPIHDYNKKITEAGGANISSTTSNALRTFWSGLDTDGTLYLMSALNPIVPDNLTGAITPLIWQSGSRYWTNFNFAASNLTVAGLLGVTADSKYLGTGIVPSTANRIIATSAGISGIVTDSPGTATQIILAGNPVTANVQTALFLAVGGNDNAQFRLWRNDAVNQNFLSSAQPSPGDTWTGYVSGNRTAANAIALYVASTVLTHQILTNATGAQTGSNAANTVALLAFASNNNGTPAGFSNHRMSFVAFHGGMTQTQSSNLWRRAETMRNSFGGGAP